VRYGTVLEGPVVHQGDFGVNEEMGVDRAAVVMTWEDGIERDDSLSVSGLDTTEEGGIESDFVSGGHGTRVVTSGVAVPDINVQILNWQAGVDVEVFNL
jgi:hypothetical protein